ncbi:OsmC family protein [Paraburkholderia sediminicola]|uniref:OsmC family protein n=1 Tax=Paraburkholderia sediminicola TaxID=458836 RepID=UPI0038BB45B2
MSQHVAAIRWQRAPHPLDERTYSRNHVASLNGEQSVNVSASVEYKGDPACVDPEQMLVSSVASCHMLTFLAIAELQKYCIQEYQDNAIGYLEKVEGGGMAVTRIELSPRIAFGGERTPDAAALNRLHASAKKNCFIGNSITATVTVATGDVVA